MTPGEWMFVLIAAAVMTALVIAAQLPPRCWCCGGPTRIPGRMCEKCILRQIQDQKRRGL